MELLIVLLLVVLLVCVLVLFVYLLNQGRRSESINAQLLAKNQEALTVSSMADQKMVSRFDSILSQMQALQKNQIHSADSLEWVQEQVEGMAQVMTNTKRRGNWGEYQLDYLLGTYLGENDSIYSTQYTLPNGKIADVALHLPGTKQVLCIDSKFPMENFMRMDDDPESRDYYLRLFMQNIKKHIDDISNKYINAYTAPQALMFIPSEAIYQFVCGNCDSLFSYALQKHVMLTSPTTLVGILFSLQTSTNDFYRAHHLEEIERELFKLKDDIERLEERTEKSLKSLDALSKQFQSVYISARKIGTRFDSMIEGKDGQHDFDN
ncbi:DNA recombination protein RmuC [Dubosiella muris]|uniref:DNA recombination protein RmuC n=1 Tax=Dubosiella muris TaxID=3038133 RepID=A0AC61R8X2_9FIRM|nr:DNA recombination protein RmuC [Dubosiella muris]TGY66470.1 DNA recombination protein RmuC [Dubosiella muris]